MNMEHWSEGSDRGKPKYSALKSVQMSLFSAQTLNELACNGTLASGVVFHLSLCRICGVTSDNSFSDGAIKRHGGESIELGVRRNIDIRSMLYLTTLIMT